MLPQLAGVFFMLLHNVKYRIYALVAPERPQVNPDLCTKPFNNSVIKPGSPMLSILSWVYLFNVSVPVSDFPTQLLCHLPPRK